MLTDGTEISMGELLDGRESRVRAQRALLKRFGRPLVSFTVNMPGPVKLCPASRLVLAEGARLLEAELARREMPVLGCERREKPTGPEAFYAVDTPDARGLKRLTCALEDGSPLGRLFDLDVLAPGGGAVNRQSLGLPPRRCLLCQNESAVCARSRAHSVAELLEKIEAIVRQAGLAAGAGRP